LTIALHIKFDIRVSSCEENERIGFRSCKMEYLEKDALSVDVGGRLKH
jgi:hypothetical protein